MSTGNEPEAIAEYGYKLLDAKLATKVTAAAAG